MSILVLGMCRNFANTGKLASALFKNCGYGHIEHLPIWKFPGTDMFFRNWLWHTIPTFGIFEGMGKRALATFVNLRARALCGQLIFCHQWAIKSGHGYPVHITISHFRLMLRSESWCLSKEISIWDEMIWNLNCDKGDFECNFTKQNFYLVSSLKNNH